MGVTVLGDDLYCHEPFCRELHQQGLDFILVCKPASHATLYEWLAFLERAGAMRTVVRRRWSPRQVERKLTPIVIETVRAISKALGYRVS